MNSITSTWDKYCTSRYHMLRAVPGTVLTDILGVPYVRCIYNLHMVSCLLILYSVCHMPYIQYRVNRCDLNVTK